MFATGFGPCLRLSECGARFGINYSYLATPLL